MPDTFTSTCDKAELDVVALAEELTLVVMSLKLRARSARPLLSIAVEFDPSVYASVAFWRNWTLLSVRLPPVICRKLSIDVCNWVQGMIPVANPKFFVKLR